MHAAAPNSRKVMMREKGSMAQPHDSHSVSGSSDSQIICGRGGGREAKGELAALCCAGQAGVLLTALRCSQRGSEGCCSSVRAASRAPQAGSAGAP